MLVFPVDFPVNLTCPLIVPVPPCATGVDGTPPAAKVAAANALSNKGAINPFIRTSLDGCALSGLHSQPLIQRKLRRLLLLEGVLLVGFFGLILESRIIRIPVGLV